MRLIPLLAGAVVPLALFLTTTSLTTASPNGAGGCQGGMAAVGGGHLTMATIETGSLSDIGIVLKINGSPLDSETTVDIPIGIDHFWELKAETADAAFRGYLLRLDGGDAGIDTTAALSPIRGKGGLIQVAETVCVEGYGVGGVTHRSRVLKDNVTGVLRLDEVSDLMNLDVTVVLANARGISRYYYSPYILRSVEASPDDVAVGQDEAVASQEPTANNEEEEILGTADEEDNGDQEMEQAGENEQQTEEPENQETEGPTTVMPQGDGDGDDDDDDDDEEEDSTSVLSTPTMRPSRARTTSQPTSRPLMSMARPTPSPAPFLMEDTGDEGDDTDLAGEDNSEGETMEPVDDAAQTTIEPAAEEEDPMEAEEVEVEEEVATTEEGLPVLSDVSPGCNENSTCTICQGDCDFDSECDGDLACFHRDVNDDSLVPGCSGRGIVGMDYCFDPIEYPDTLREFDIDCTVDKPCGKCEGDCDRDEHCEGDLRCFMRDGNETVPGCYGLGFPGRDYCFDGNDMPADEEPVEDLEGAPTAATVEDQSTNEPTEGEESTMEDGTPGPVAEEDETPEPVAEEDETPDPVTEEDSTPEPVTEEDSTSEPVADEGSTPEPVVEEDGTPEPAADTDEESTPEPVAEEDSTPEPVAEEDTPTEAVEEEESTLEPTNEGGDANMDEEGLNNEDDQEGEGGARPLLEATCSFEEPCNECEGDCDFDDHCQGDLECFPRRGGADSRVPGCTGSGTAGWDYCYKPEKNTLRPRSERCSVESPCVKCQADCDDDTHCVGDLKCFLRNQGDVEIPGCNGSTISNIDYCYDPADMEEDEAVAVGRNNPNRIRRGLRNRVN